MKQLLLHGDGKRPRKAAGVNDSVAAILGLEPHGMRLAIWKTPDLQGNILQKSYLFPCKKNPLCWDSRALHVVNPTPPEGPLICTNFVCNRRTVTRPHADAFSPAVYGQRPQVFVHQAMRRGICLGLETQDSKRNGAETAKHLLRGVSAAEGPRGQLRWLRLEGAPLNAVTCQASRSPCSKHTERQRQLLAPAWPSSLRFPGVQQQVSFARNEWKHRRRRPYPF